MRNERGKMNREDGRPLVVALLLGVGLPLYGARLVGTNFKKQDTGRAAGKVQAHHCHVTMHVSAQINDVCSAGSAVLSQVFGVCKGSALTLTCLFVFVFSRWTKPRASCVCVISSRTSGTG